MFGSRKIKELENELSWARKRIDIAEAQVSKKQADEHESRSWVEQGKETGIKTLVVSGGQLLRLEDGRTFFLPTMHSVYASNGGYAAATSQSIVPL